MRFEKIIHSFNVKIFIYFLIFATALFALTFTYLHNAKSDGYILGDWLINYQDGGFKRRGLSGSFFFFLQDISGIKLQLLVYFFQVMIISGFFYFYFKLIRYKEATFLYLSLLLSSIGFVGIFNCVDYVGKKEFILFFLLAYFINQLDENSFSKSKEYIICALLCVSMFFHEINMFFIPYFIIALYLKTGKVEFKRYLKYIIVVFVPAILLFLFGKNINEGNSLEILKERGVVLTKGIFFWNINERDYIIQHFTQYRLYFLSFALSIAHISFYLKYQNHRKVISILLILAFIFSLPLFYLAIDWGRWLYIHMICIIIVFGMLLKDTSTPLSFEKITLNGKFFITLFIILASLLYRVEMSGSGFTFQGFFYRIFVAPVELLNKML